MDEYIEKHLTDILISINEIESYFVKGNMRYDKFAKNILRQRAVERNVEIIGEAVNRILKIEPAFELANARAIVNTRTKFFISSSFPFHKYSAERYDERTNGPLSTCLYSKE